MGKDEESLKYLRDSLHKLANLEELELYLDNEDL